MNYSLRKGGMCDSLWILAGVLAMLAAEIAAAKTRFGFTGNFYVSIFIFCVLAAITTCCLAVKREDPIPLEKLYLILGIGLGLIFLVLIPVYVAPDEKTHFFTAYDLSNKLLGIHDEDGRISVRACDLAIPVKKHYTDAASYNQYWSYFFASVGDTSLKYKYFSLSRANPLSHPVMYLPSALAITLCRLLHTNAMTLMLAGRLVNMLCYVFFVQLSIRLAPFGKFLLTTLALMPMSLQQASSYSYDWFLNAAAFLAASQTLHVLALSKNGDAVRTRDWVVLCAACGALFFCKGKAYSPIALLPVFFWLHAVFSQHRAWRRVFWGGVLALAVVVVLFVIWRTYFASGDLVKDPGVLIPRQGNQKGYSLQYCINHPAFVFQMFGNTIKVRSDFYFQTFLGRALGWLDLPVPWSLLTVYSLVLIAALPQPDSYPVCLDIAERGLMWAAVAFSIFFIHLGMLITWTPVGEAYIKGVQGRYFIPVAFPLLVSFKLTNYSVPRALERGNFWLLVLTLHAIVVYMTLHIRYTF